MGEADIHCAVGYVERRFLFFPVSDLVYTPADVNLEYEGVRIKTSDGLIINGWFIPA